MANFYSEQYTKMFQSNPPQNVQANELRGRVRVAFFKYTTDASENADDLIYFTRLPAGARVIGGQIAWADVGAASSVMHVGTADDPDHWIASLAMSSAGTSQILASNLGTYMGEELSAETNVIGKIVTADFDAAGDIVGYLLYVVD